MSALFIALSAGIVVAQCQLRLDAGSALLAATAALVGLLLITTSLLACRPLPRSLLRVELLLVALLLGFSVSCARATQRLAERLPRDAADQLLTVRAWVADLPQTLQAGQRVVLALPPPARWSATALDNRPPAITAVSTVLPLAAPSFAADLANAAGLWQGRPVLVSVILPAKLTTRQPPVRGGDCHVWHLQLRPVHATLNFSGFDGEAWMWMSGIVATGMVRALQPCEGVSWSAGPALQALRDQLRTRLQQVLGERPGAAMVIALAVGDQSGVTQSQWNALWRTGVGHLVSISGVHVTLFASLLRMLAKRLWRISARACRFCPAASAAALLGLAAALFYALLAGYAIPTRRTLFMLGAAWLFTARGVLPGSGRVFWAAVVTTLLSDPFAALSPSFWLSFGAVGGLVLAGLGHFGQRAPWRAELHAQWVANLSLLPMMVLCFGQLSLVSPLANAVAIPLVSLLITPLTLASLFPGLTALAQLAAWLCETLLQCLAWLAAPTWASLDLAQPGAPAVALAAAAAWILLTPVGGPRRSVALLACLPLLLPPSAAPQMDNAVVEMIDVGQGLSVLVRTAAHTLLFDSGPRWPGGDAGGRTVIPLLRSAGISHLDMLVLSHPDADHVGGADSILAAVPTDAVATGFFRPGAVACAQGQHWRWDGVDFTMLYPDAGSTAAQSVLPASASKSSSARRDAHQRNNHACVLRISVGSYSLLLPADIEAPAEQALLRQAALRSQLRSTVIVVAHHGSKTSSTEPWVAAVHPRLALISLGWRNHFRHPDAAVVARWLHAGASVLRTDQSGGARVLLSSLGVRWATARSARPAYWRPDETDSDQNPVQPHEK